MKDETRHWLSYAEENLEMARLAHERGYFNACLQNAQQAVELCWWKRKVNFRKLTVSGSSPN